MYIGLFLFFLLPVTLSDWKPHSHCGVRNQESYLTDYHPGFLSKYYDMAANFLDVLHQRNIPYDALEVLFQRHQKEGSGNHWGTVLLNQSGFILAVTCGVLFVVFMPIVGCMFCYCRCCGLCGGKLYQGKPEEPVCYCLYAAAIICFIFLLTGTILFIVSSKEAFNSGESTGQLLVDESMILARFVSQLALDLSCEIVDLFFRLLGDSWELLLSLADTVVQTIDQMTSIGATIDLVVQLNNAEGELKAFAFILEKIENTSLELNRSVSLLQHEFGSIFVADISRELSDFHSGVQRVKPDLMEARRKLDKIMKPHVSSWMENARGFLLVQVKKLEKEIVEATGEAQELAKSKIGELKGTLTNLTSTAEEKIQKGIETGAEKAHEKIHEISGKVEEKVHEVAENAEELAEEGKKKLQEAGTAAKELGQEVKEKSKMVGEVVKNAVKKGKQKVEDVQEEAEEFGENLKEKTKDLQSKANELVDKGQEKVEEVQKEAEGKVKLAENKLGDLAEEGQEKVNKVAESVKETMDKVEEKGEEVLDKVKDRSKAFKADMKKNYQKGKDVGEGLISKVEETAGNLADKSDGVKRNVEEEAYGTKRRIHRSPAEHHNQGMAQDVKQKAEAAVEGFGADMEGKAEEVGEKAKELMHSGGKAVQSGVNKAAKTMEEMTAKETNKLHNAISGAEKKLHNAVDDVGGAAHEKISELANPIRENLDFMAKNVTHAVGGKVQTTLNKAADAASSLASGKAAEKIQSMAVPFAEKLGKKAEKGLTKAGQTFSKLAGEKIQEKMDKAADKLIEAPEELLHGKVDALVEKVKNLTSELGENAEDKILEWSTKLLNLTVGNLQKFNDTFNKVQHIADNTVTAINMLLTNNRKKINKTYEDIQNRANSTWASLLIANESLRNVSVSVEKTLRHVEQVVQSATAHAAKSADKSIHKMFKNRVKGISLWPALVISIPIFLGLLCMCCGVTCGTCGYRRDRHPTKRTWISHKGGNCLICSMCWIFWISAPYMVLTIILFFIGYSLELFCFPLFLDEELRAYDFFSTWTDNITISDTVTYRLDVKHAVRACSQDKGAYGALKLDTILKPHLDQAHSKIKDSLTSIPVDKIENLITPDLVFQLPDWINKTLSPLMQSMEQLSVTVADETSFLYKKPMKTAKAIRDLFIYIMSLNGLSSVNAVSLYNNATQLSYTLGNFSQALYKSQASIETLQPLLEVLVYDLNETTRFKDAEAIANFTKRRTRSILTTIHRSIGSYMDQIHGDLRDQLVKCKPLYELWENFGTSICKQFGFPLHGMWFGIGWCVFFFIPIIIINVRLAKYFRRMKVRYYPEYLDDPFEADYAYGYEDPPPSYDEVVGSAYYGRSPHDVEEAASADEETKEEDEGSVDVDETPEKEPPDDGQKATDDAQDGSAEAVSSDPDMADPVEMELGTIAEEPDKETAEALWSKDDDMDITEEDTEQKAEQNLM